MGLDNLSQKIKRGIFDFLIRSLRKSASLKIKTALLTVGKISYLDNNDHFKKKKDTLVLIHGLGADKDTWLQLAKYLTKSYRIIALDLPGHGLSTQDFSIYYSVELQAQCINELLSNLKIQQVHIIGSSMGGAIATKLTYMHPEIVSSLILIDSYGVFKKPSYLSKLADELGYNPMLEINTKDDYKKMLSLAMIKPPFIPAFMLDILTEDMKERVELNKKIFRDTDADSDQKPILSKIKKPSLVVWGAQDKILHVDNAEVFNKKLQNCSKVIIEEAGHVPMVEKPKVVARYITNFIHEIG